MQSLRLSRTRGMARLFFGIKFLGSRVREYKACLRLLKIWHGHGLVSLNHNSLGLAPHAAVNLVSDTHAHFVLPPNSGENGGELPNPIFANRGVEANYQVVLVQHVQHNHLVVSSAAG